MQTKADSETSEVMSRRLRTRLRQARQDAGLTQQAVAAELYWSVSKLIRIESGAVLVVPTDVRAMLDLYGVADPSDVRSMINLARRCRAQHKYAEYRDIISPNAIKMFANEDAATIIYKYEPAAIPGLFQTESYCRALITAIEAEPEAARKGVELRLKRQAMLTKPEHPCLQFIIGEAALRCLVGSPEVMMEQFNHLERLAMDPSIAMHVLKFAAGPHRSLGAAFTVLLFDDPGLSDLLYFEDINRDSFVNDDATKIDQFLEIFGELEALASPTERFAIYADRIVGERPDL